MLQALLAVLVVLYFVGIVKIPWLVIPDFPILVILGRTITLWMVLKLIVFSWIIGILPSPFRQIIGVLIILWLLSLFGIIAIAGFTNLITLAIIIGIVLAIVNH